MVLIYNIILKIEETGALVVFTKKDIPLLGYQESSYIDQNNSLILLFQVAAFSIALRSFLTSSGFVPCPMR